MNAFQTNNSDWFLLNSLQHDQQKRKERILTTTRELLSKQGYDGINMRDLAVAADVATTTLYNLYQSKDSLILAALIDLLEQMTADAQSNGMNELEMLMKKREVHANQVVLEPHYAEAMTIMLFNAEPSDQIVRIMIGEVTESNRQHILKAIHEGLLEPDLDVKLLSRELTATGTSNLFLWMKGFVALQDFFRESMLSHIDLLLGFATTSGEELLLEYRSRYV